MIKEQAIHPLDVVDKFLPSLKAYALRPGSRWLVQNVDRDRVDPLMGDYSLRGLFGVASVWCVGAPPVEISDYHAEALWPEKYHKSGRPHRAGLVDFAKGLEELRLEILQRATQNPDVLAGYVALRAAYDQAREVHLSVREERLARCLAERCHLWETGRFKHDEGAQKAALRDHLAEIEKAETEANSRQNTRLPTDALDARSLASRAAASLEQPVPPSDPLVDAQAVSSRARALSDEARRRNEEGRARGRFPGRPTPLIADHERELEWALRLMERALMENPQASRDRARMRVNELAVEEGNPRPPTRARAEQAYRSLRRRPPT